jgi:hypothetical protein
VARLRPPANGSAGLAEAVEGRWWVANRRGADVDAGREGSETTIARYRPALFGGRIGIEDDGRYRLRAPMLGDSVRLRRRRTLVASIKGIHEVALGPAVTSPLPILIALQALLLEETMPHIGGGGASG